MFRVKEPHVLQESSLVERFVQVILVLAFLASLGSIYLNYQEERWLAILLNSPEAVPSPTLELLRQEVDLQILASLIVAVILMLGMAALWWLRRRYAVSQNALRQVKMLAHDILASMDRGVVTTNRKGIISSINSAGIHLLSVDFECVGQPLSSISSPQIPLVEVCREVEESRTTARDRDFSLDRNGRPLRLRISGHGLKDIKGKALGCVIHLRDVTERMFMEDRMRRMERFLGLATLASGLHHEIKNPLTALSIHIQLLEESLACAGDSVTELVGILKSEMIRLNGVLDSFGSFAHLQHLSLQPTDIVEVVENAVRLIRPQATQQRVQITLLHPEKELPAAPLDTEKFQQAVLNLIINALEAMPEGGQLTISAGLEEGTVKVSVRDSGPGIPPEVQRNLFQPYFSTKSKGSGMGLALSEKLIGQHGGNILFNTGPEGTTFCISVPLEQRNGEHEKQELSHPDRG